MQEQFDKMCQTGMLFRANVAGDTLWDIYLKSFSPEDNPKFRDPQSSTHNCKLCNNFIRRYGSIVSIDSDGNLMTLFDFEVDGEYGNVAVQLSKFIRSAQIHNVFFESYAELNALNYEKCNIKNPVFKLGLAKNAKVYTEAEALQYGVVEAGKTYVFNHMNLEIPTAFIHKDAKVTLPTLLSGYRDKINVFKRSMEELTVESMVIARDLIKQGSFLDGEAHLPALESLLELRTEKENLVKEGNFSETWYWAKTYAMHDRIAKFGNTLIGESCYEIAEGKDLNLVCQTWNKRVDPVNYMKAKPAFTEKQKQAAMQYVQENGFEGSFARRVAKLDDIKVSEILHVNVGKSTIKPVSVFDGLTATKTTTKKMNFDGVEEVSIDKFMSDILPSCNSVELYLENRLIGNMVTMTTAQDLNSKPMFKWPNPFSWSYNGNLAGKSRLTEMVVEHGGRIDGVFRFTHSWNEIEPNQSLMDLHVFMPGCITKAHGSSSCDQYGSGRRVGWNNRKDHQSGGVQDVDHVREAQPGFIPVENITFPTISNMPEGTYTCKIHNWNFRKSGGKGKAEIAFGGCLYQYEYPATTHKQWITIAEVTLRNGMFTIEHAIPPVSESSAEIYGLNSQEFHKVNLICHSPNHWEGTGVGNKHFFFMLEGCKAQGDIRSFHNENLVPELVQHRNVLEALGAMVVVPSEDGQLSGVGFNATVRDEVVVKLTGSFNRVLKIKF